ncbi:sigma-54-dependent Fis family transcriptional regulator [Dethiobacter alkaliphilus]|uniref:GAF modulated sigma54 specific transcriptional regulator, Fis family n=1 Tax=Dethiobacter alkaliphilus AHT 1 TaxID=555088 RepID=C0GJ16_DETAL|nr:sigma-54-dependent Fis family transcriptional regulator [Dethiobacter alkaliphilus]EEG76649.1 GAF modulated sigma54 specific transcriptional regulator, Fis family [Dethiobacter alkaliphilus AHT 1]
MSRVWQRFVAGEASPQEVSPVIYRSWQRSKQRELSHKRVYNDEILPAALLNERCLEHEDLVRAGKPVLPYLYRFLEGSNNIVMLCDDQGYILDSLGDPPFINKAQQVHLSPGANWSEAVRGTNAIGTVLVEKVPLQVLGWEHYVEQNHVLNCWAAPICNADGDVVGVLDVSGEAGIERGMERLAEVVLMGAKLIEQSLHLTELQRDFHFARQGIEKAGEMMRDGFIAIDSRGIITEINREGAKLLGRKREELVGHLAADVFDNRRWSFNGKSLYMQSSESDNLTSRLVKVTDEQGAPMGAIGVLSPAPREERSQETMWVGRSQATQSVFSRADKAAQTSSTVLIQGESGTGKEIVARYLHQQSPRHNKPFVAINCAAIPATLIESELFGYADGAFTGAKKGGAPGKFEVAQGGTVFLDEIGDMPSNVQASLLRVLQEREVVRIGDSRPRPVDVRVVAATNRDLSTRIEQGDFRLDLYYRLKVVTIDVPPLSRRLDDIYDLVPYFVKKICRASGREPMGVTDEVYEALLNYHWPGNIRELENCMESMVAMAEHSYLTTDDLPAEIAKNVSAVSCGETLLEQQTKKAIMQALAETNGKIAPAARLLGIGRTTLYRKIEELGIKS